MFANPENIISLTDFKRGAADVVRRIKRDKSPAVLTINGAASVVVLDAVQYQNMLRDAEVGAIMRGINAGLDDMENNRGYSLDTVSSMLDQEINRVAKRRA